MNSEKKFQKSFLLFTIGQFCMVLGAVTIGSNFKVLPSWLIFFGIFTFIGIILMLIAFKTFYKVNRNYFRALIALVAYILLVIFTDACSKSKDDMYLTLSRGLEISSAFVSCIFYVYSFLGTRDYFNETNIAKGKKRAMTGAIILVVLFVTQQVLAFLSSFDFAKQSVVAFSIFRFGSWGLQLFTYVFIFAVLLGAYIIYMKKKKGEVTSDEERK